LPLGLLMGREEAVANSCGFARASAAGVFAGSAKLKRTTLKIYLRLAGGVAYVPAKLHACAL
jgi:hypothetical protein